MEADTVAGLHTHDNFFTHEFAGGTNYYSDEESDGSDDPRLLDPRYLDMKANMKVDFNLVAPTVAHQQPSQACGLGGLHRRASAAPSGQRIQPRGRCCHYGRHTTGRFAL